MASSNSVALLAGLLKGLQDKNPEQAPEKRKLVFKPHSEEDVSTLTSFPCIPVLDRAGQPQQNPRG